MWAVDELIRIVDARIGQKLSEQTQAGTVVARTSPTDAMVVLDGSQAAMPCKVAGNAPAHEGDRVYVTRFGRWWVVVGAGANRGTQERIQEAIVPPGGANVITFGNISQDYTHLRLMGAMRSDAAALDVANCRVRYNGDTAARYSMMSVDATNAVTTPGIFLSSAQTGLTWAAAIPAANILPQTRGGIDITIWDYTDTAFATKQLYSISGFADFGTTVQMRHRWGVWDPTTAQAITSIEFACASGNFVAGSRLALWGLS